MFGCRTGENDDVKTINIEDYLKLTRLYSLYEQYFNGTITKEILDNKVLESFK